MGTLLRLSTSMAFALTLRAVCFGQYYTQSVLDGVVRMTDRHLKDCCSKPVQKRRALESYSTKVLVCFFWSANASFQG
jgi:hypothetical protein